jgi:hypothetical protein
MSINFSYSQVEQRHLPPLDLLERLAPRLAGAYRNLFANRSVANDKAVREAFSDFSGEKVEALLADAEARFNQAQTEVRAAGDEYRALLGLRDWTAPYSSYRPAAPGVLEPVKARASRGLMPAGTRLGVHTRSALQTGEPGSEAPDPRIRSAA